MDKTTKAVNGINKTQDEAKPEPKGQNVPYYEYTGPKDTRREDCDWTDYGAYDIGLWKTPTGSIHIVHEKMQMLCRVTESQNLPGFIVTCKDENGTAREVHIFFNDRENSLSICTSQMTCREIDDSQEIHRKWVLPFTCSALATRGKIYDAILNTKIRFAPSAYDDVKIRQHLTEMLNGLPARWPEGHVREQTLKLDSDLILKQDLIDAINENDIPGAGKTVVRLMAETIKVL